MTDSTHIISSLKLVAGQVGEYAACICVSMYDDFTFDAPSVCCEQCADAAPLALS